MFRNAVIDKYSVEFFPSVKSKRKIFRIRVYYYSLIETDHPLVIITLLKCLFICYFPEIYLLLLFFISSD